MIETALLCFASLPFVSQSAKINNSFLLINQIMEKMKKLSDGNSVEPFFPLSSPSSDVFDALEIVDVFKSSVK